MGMRSTVLILVSVLALAAACNERILPPPLDGGEGGAGGEATPPKHAPTSSPESDKVPAFKHAGKP